MEDQIKELSGRVDEMKTVAESVQEMKARMVQLMELMRAGGMVEGHSPTKAPQFQPGFTTAYYPHVEGTSSQEQARVQSKRPYHSINPVEGTSAPVIIPEPDKVKKKNALKEIEDEQKWESLEKRLRAVEGPDTFGAVNASNLCLVTDVMIPPKLKVPEFEKYDAKGCPAIHLTMYVRKMAALTHDDKLLIHFFQDSLTGSATTWYMKLDRSKICNWKDLANAFLSQYKYLTEMAPSRTDLQSMEKKSNESFKEYAQRWRDLAAQVQPPLSENELETLFIGTLKAPYYDKLIAHTSGSFLNLVIAGERIDEGIRRGKIPVSFVEKQEFKKENEGETYAVGLVSHGNNHSNCHTQNHIYRYPSYNSPQRPNYSPSKSRMSSLAHGQPRKPSTSRRNKRNNSKIIQPIPMSYSELLPELIKNNQLSLKNSKPLQPPYPEWYDLNARCDYHIGSMGHSTEDCIDLKRKVQALRDAKLLSFGEGSNVLNND